MASLTDLKAIVPPKLKKGDVIGIVSPSSAIRAESLKRGVNFLEDKGFKIILGKTVTNVYSRGFTSASDTQRTDELMDFFTRRDIKAIFTSTGGYGSTRIINKLNYNDIKNNPKILMGFSDTTSLQLAIWKKTGLITFSGPTPEMTEKNYKNDQWGLEAALAILMGKIKAPFNLIIPESTLPRILGNHQGSAIGRLLGGNLTMVCSLLGTDFDPPLKDKILFMEEVNESGYKIEMMLQQLKLAYKLDYLKGAIMGEFVNIEGGHKSKTASESDPSIDEILIQKFSQYDYPIVYGYPFSHGKYCITIPQGVRAKITTPAVEILENVVE